MKYFVRKTVQLLPLIILIISFIFFITAFFIKDIPVNETYRYINGKIERFSWHNYFEIISSVILWIIFLLVLASTVINIILRIKSGTKSFMKLIFIWLSGIICYCIVLIGNLLVVGFWSKNDYNPICYEFTDGRHVVVIEEKSFLLYGGGTIYQILNKDQAIVIGRISTDDGGRNNGNYSIKWYGDRAEISYNDFVTEDSRLTETVIFQ